MIRFPHILQKRLPYMIKETYSVFTATAFESKDPLFPYQPGDTYISLLRNKVARRVRYDNEQGRVTGIVFA